jgi:hypothetical protein
MARRCHDVMIGGAPFSIDVRYQNLKQIGGGSYGIVCSADDTIENRFGLPLIFVLLCSRASLHDFKRSFSYLQY